MAELYVHVRDIAAGRMCRLLLRMRIGLWERREREGRWAVGEGEEGAGGRGRCRLVPRGTAGGGGGVHGHWVVAVFRGGRAVVHGWSAGGVAVWTLHVVVYVHVWGVFNGADCHGSRAVVRGGGGESEHGWWGA